MKVYAQVAAAIAILQAAVLVHSQEIMKHIEKKIQLKIKGAVVSSLIRCVMIYVHTVRMNARQYF